MKTTPENVEEKGSDKPEVTEKTKPAEEKSAEPEVKQETPAEEGEQGEKGQIKEESTPKVLTFAERLKLKKQQKEREEKTEEGKQGSASTGRD